MYKLNKSELQDAIIGLEMVLHNLQGNAERTGRYDEELPDARTALTKLRKQLELASIGEDIDVCG